MRNLIEDFLKKREGKPTTNHNRSTDDDGQSPTRHSWKTKSSLPKPYGCSPRIRKGISSEAMLGNVSVRIKLTRELLEEHDEGNPTQAGKEL